MEKNKTIKTLVIVIFVLIAMLMGTWMLFGHKIDEYKQLLEKTDTIEYSDTIYLDKVVRDSIPVVQYKKVLVRDTLWKVQGDSVVGEPQIITLVKKKSAIH